MQENIIFTREMLIDEIEKCTSGTVNELAARLSLTLAATKRLMDKLNVAIPDNSEDLCDLAQRTVTEVMKFGNNTERLNASKFVLEKLSPKFKEQKTSVSDEYSVLVAALIKNAEGK